MSREIPYLGSDMAKLAPRKGELITDRAELSQAMGEISTAAFSSGYPNAGYGFMMYKMVTDEVDDWIEKEQFKDPDKMARTVPQFADLAFDPLREEGPWQYFYTSMNSIHAHPVISAMDFMTDHVEEDLAYALHLTDTREEHRYDYFDNMNKIFDVVIDKFTPYVADITPTQKAFRLHKIGIAAAKHLLRSSRDYAFDARLDYRQANSEEEIKNVRIRHRNNAEQHMLSRSKGARFTVRKVVKPPTSIYSVA